MQVLTFRGNAQKYPDSTLSNTIFWDAIVMASGLYVTHAIWYHEDNTYGCVSPDTEKLPRWMNVSSQT